MDHKLMNGAPESYFEDKMVFGKFLARSRFDLRKSVVTMTSKIPVNASSIEQWERGIALPEEDKLPIIARTYSIDLKELQKLYRISKTASQKEASVRKSL